MTAEEAVGEVSAEHSESAQGADDEQALTGGEPDSTAPAAEEIQGASEAASPAEADSSSDAADAQEGAQAGDEPA